MKNTKKMPKKSNATKSLNKRTASVLAIAVIALGGLSVYAYTKPSEPVASVNTQPIVTERDALPDNLTEILSFDDVNQRATENTEATVEKLELSTKDSSVVFKVRLSDRAVIVLDAVTGQILEDMEVESEDNDNEPLPANATIRLSFEEARKVAVQKYPNSALRKIELDVEEGRVVFSVRFQDKARVDVDAETGEIVRAKDPKAKETKSEKKAAPVTSNRDSTKQQSQSDDKDEDRDASPKQQPKSGSSDNKSGSTRDDKSDESEDEDEDKEIRIEGTLFVSNNSYMVSSYGVTYTIEYSNSLSGLVGKLIRVEGELRTNNVIVAEEVENRS